MLQFFKGLARFMVHHILKMTKEGFHRGIIPAVSPTGHGLAETQLFDSVLELVVGIMDALIGIFSLVSDASPAFRVFRAFLGIHFLPPNI
jgi:hypothetical protein